jgi:hypothetical protein
MDFRSWCDGGFPRIERMGRFETQPYKRQRIGMAPSPISRRVCPQHAAAAEAAVE